MKENNLNFNAYGRVTDIDSPDYGRTKTAVYSRNMGYIRPISNFNIGKRAEFEERKLFKECLCLQKA